MVPCLVIYALIFPTLLFIIPLSLFQRPISDTRISTIQNLPLLSPFAVRQSIRKIRAIRVRETFCGIRAFCVTIVAQTHNYRISTPLSIHFFIVISSKYLPPPAVHTSHLYTPAAPYHSPAPALYAIVLPERLLLPPDHRE